MASWERIRPTTPGLATSPSEALSPAEAGPRGNVTRDGPAAELAFGGAEAMGVQRPLRSEIGKIELRPRFLLFLSRSHK